MTKRRESAAIAVTSAIAVLSIATGIATLSYEPYVTPLAVHVPDTVRTAVSMTGAFTGFAMLLTAWGLKRRLRVAWYSALLLYPVTALQGVAQSNVLSVPLVVLSLAAVPALVASRRSFRREMSLTQGQWSAAAALVGALAYGTLGSYALRDQYTSVETPLDAFYYTVVTMSTVGYGDLTPTTQLARVFALSFIVVGTASFAFALATLVTPAIESRLTKALGKVTERQLESLQDHVVVLGTGGPSGSVVDALSGRADAVVVTSDGDSASRLKEHGALVVEGEPADELSLQKARVEDAAAVVAATNDDATDALGLLTVRDLAPDTRVVASAVDSSNIENLRRAGADTVISPATIVGGLVAESALHGVDVGREVDEAMEGVGAGGQEDEGVESDISAFFGDEDRSDENDAVDETREEGGSEES